MAELRDLGDLAAELKGIEGTVETLSLIVQPKDAIGAGSTVSEETLLGAFYHVSRALERVSDDLSTLEGVYLRMRAHEQAV